MFWDFAQSVKGNNICNNYKNLNFKLSQLPQTVPLLKNMALRPWVYKEMFLIILIFVFFHEFAILNGK